jgi:hypothetical protein
MVVVILQVISKEVEHEGLEMLICTWISDPVPLVWVDLQLVRFLGLDQGINEHFCVLEMYILVNKAVDNQQTIFTSLKKEIYI